MQPVSGIKGRKGDKGFVRVSVYGSVGVKYKANARLSRIDAYTVPSKELDPCWYHGWMDVFEF